MECGHLPPQIHPNPLHSPAGQTRALGPANLLSLRSQHEPNSVDLVSYREGGWAMREGFEQGRVRAQ
jgi:hypothetical protein